MPFSTFNSNIDAQHIQIKLNHYLRCISVRAVFPIHTSATAKCRASSSKRIANGTPGRDPNPTGRRPHNLQGIMILLGKNGQKHTGNSLSCVAAKFAKKKKRSSGSNFFCLHNLHTVGADWHVFNYKKSIKPFNFAQFASLEVSKAGNSECDFTASIHIYVYPTVGGNVKHPGSTYSRIYSNVLEVLHFPGWATK